MKATAGTERSGAAEPLASQDVRMGVLASGSGTILSSLIAADLPIAVVAVDRPCGAEEIASAASIPVLRVIRDRFDAGFDRASFTEALLEALEGAGIDLVAMAGFATVLAPAFFAAFPGRVVNTHPALLPSFKGWHAVEAALEAGVEVTGCTVHVATPAVDDGPILAQAEVPVLADDTVETLHERIKQVERTLYPKTLRAILEAGGDPTALVREPKGHLDTASGVAPRSERKD